MLSAEVHGTLTEADVADVFVETALGKILFNHTPKKWLLWTGSHWQANETSLAYEAIRRLVQVNSDRLSPKDKKKARSASFARGAETFARVDTRVAKTADAFDTDRDLLGTLGGTVHLPTGVIRPANPANLISKVTRFSTPSFEKPVRWLEFVHEAMSNNTAMVRLLQQWSGYALTGHNREEKFLFAHGKGGRGKGTFIETIAKVAGDYSANASMNVFMASDFDRHPTEIT